MGPPRTPPHTSRHAWTPSPIHNSWLRHCVPLITNEQSATATLVWRRPTRQLLNIGLHLSSVIKGIDNN